MYIAVVKQKYSKKNRRWFYIFYYAILLVTFPLLIALDIPKSMAGILFAIMVITSLILIQKFAEDVEIIGTVEIKTDSFEVIQNGEKILIPFSEIQMFLLNPLLGTSRVAETYKAYDCQIRTSQKNYRFTLTREELRNGKVRPKNLMRPNAFDLITFLKQKNIQYRIDMSQ